MQSFTTVKSFNYDRKKVLLEDAFKLSKKERSLKVEAKTGMAGSRNRKMKRNKKNSSFFQKWLSIIILEKKDLTGMFCSKSRGRCDWD